MSKRKHYSSSGSETPQVVEISFYCAGCRKPHHLEVERGSVHGGCMGNHGPGEYCYCPTRHWDVTVDCPKCNAIIDVEVDA